LLRQVDHLAHGVRGRDDHRIAQHARLITLDLGHLGRLVAWRQVLVHDADAALLRDGDGQARFGDRVHGGRHQGQVQRDIAGEAGGEGGVLGRTWEYAGTNNTSSKVSALPSRRMSKLQMGNCTRGRGPPRAVHCAHEADSTLFGALALPGLRRSPGPMAMGRQGWPQGLQRPCTAARDSGQEHPEAARWWCARRRHRGTCRCRGAVWRGSSAAAAPGGDNQALGTPRLTGVDKELADKKKQAEAAALAKAKADEDRVQKARADNCERAKANKALMDSGVRVSHTKANGEREILDDAGREAELKRIQIVMETNCK
jgi:hypothetical protein